MAQSRSKFLCLLILLAAAAALGAAHRAQACPQGMSGSEHRSCCDGMDPAAMPAPSVQYAPHDCATTFGRVRGCASTGHCRCGQAVRVQATAREVRPFVLAPSPLPVWPGPPVAAGRIPPSQGPPTGFADPAARHTYLATLRLRI